MSYRWQVRHIQMFTKKLAQTSFYRKIFFLSLEGTISVISFRADSSIIILDNDHSELRLFLFLIYISMIILPSSPSKSVSYTILYYCNKVVRSSCVTLRKIGRILRTIYYNNKRLKQNFVGRNTQTNNWNMYQEKWKSVSMGPYCKKRCVVYYTLRCNLDGLYYVYMLENDLFFCC